MFSIKLEEKLYKMSFKALPVKILRSKTNRGATSLSPPGADRVKQTFDKTSTKQKLCLTLNVKYGASFQQKIEIYFYDDRSRFYYERSRFSWWTVEIFIMNSRDFLNERSRFSLWQVKIFMVNSRDFMMNGRHFHDSRSRLTLNGLDERSRFSWWTV